MRIGDKDSKLVVILGAGASKASEFNLPVMSGFFEAYREDYPKLFKFLDWLYPGRQISDYNLEDVLAFLNISLDRLPCWGLHPSGKTFGDYEEIYSLVLEYVERRLSIPPGKICPLHQRLFKGLYFTDSILTLNYDLVADQALLEVGGLNAHREPQPDFWMGKLGGLLNEQTFLNGPQPPSLMPRELVYGFYLKLHGSIDWLYCPTPRCRNNENIFSRSIHGLSEGQNKGQPCRVCGAALQTMIVPPIAAKRIENRGKIAFFWHLALRELRSASQILFVGISLAPTDFELRWLIREAFAHQQEKVTIHIVNPDKEHRNALILNLPSCDYRIHEYKCLQSYLEKNYDTA